MQTKSVPFTFTRNGYFYFSRRVPTDLQHHYSYPRVVQGLNTKSPQTAKTRAMVEAAKLDAYWAKLRIASSEPLGKALLRSEVASPAQKINTVHNVESVAATGPTLAEALALYRHHKGKGRSKTFHTAAERACTYLVEACGLKQLTSYTRADALKFCEWLVARGINGASVVRVFTTLKALINFAIAEHALDTRNPFSGVYLDRKDGIVERKPISNTQLRCIQAKCRGVDDEMRWLVALVSDTGMRLAEATGLLLEDLHTEATPPFVRIAPHSWRSLKTDSSKRDVPLTGSSLWAANRILANRGSSRFAFPRYNKGNSTNANSASAALNKWLKQYVPEGCSMHSFRHSLRDRLRAVECPADIVDQIGGWQTDGVGHGYGEGYPLQVCSSWMDRIAD